jgi:hypothetical protein
VGHPLLSNDAAVLDSDPTNKARRHVARHARNGRNYWGMTPLRWVIQGDG